MDLYKWAYKLIPATPAELLADCFELAVEVRELDMRASPYDLAALGYPPVRIETPAGRAEYARAQAGFTARARPAARAAAGPLHDAARRRCGHRSQTPTGPDRYPARPGPLLDQAGG